MTYIPEFDQYVDSTLGKARFGSLSEYELGKIGLLSKDGESRVVTLPMQQRQQTTQSQIHIKINADGTATGNESSTYQGFPDLAMRFRLADIGQNYKSKVVESVLTSKFQSGSGEYQHSDLQDLSKPLTTTMNYTLTDVFEPDNEGTLKLPNGANMYGIDAYILSDFDRSKLNNYAFLPLKANLDTEWQYELPENMTIVQMPKNVDFSNHVGHYQAQYQATGNKIVVKRSYENLADTAYLSAEFYPEMQALNKKIKSDFNKMVTYKMK
ncbi:MULTISPECIES: DUF3858 domain-containing protein [unclassified Acinetobacter]|uniref:DUF3858 domain-containing protein n=1 Tax=unclassified Acinetobacter TaxID=196816 RepID=UPI0035B7813C